VHELTYDKNDVLAGATELLLNTLPDGLGLRQAQGKGWVYDGVLNSVSGVQEAAEQGMHHRCRRESRGASTADTGGN